MTTSARRDGCSRATASGSLAHLRLQQRLRVGSATGGVLTSIVMSTYNAAEALKESLPLLFAHTTGPRTDLLMLLDSSTDSSLKVVQRHVRGSAWPFSQVVVFESAWPLFEAAGEAALMRRSNATHFFVSVQPDQQVHQRGWDKALQQPFVEYTDVFAVSGRCAHSLVGGDAAGFCGVLGYTRPTTAALAQWAGRFHVRNTCNRGPLVLHAPRTRALGYYDHELYSLDNSEHDLICRAQRAGGFVAGFVAIDVVSPRVHRTVVRKDRHRNPEAAALSRCASREIAAHRERVQARRVGCFDEHRASLRPVQLTRPLRRADGLAALNRTLVFGQLSRRQSRLMSGLFVGPA